MDTRTVWLLWLAISVEMDRRTKMLGLGIYPRLEAAQHALLLGLAQ